MDRDFQRGWQGRGHAPGPPYGRDRDRHDAGHPAGFKRDRGPGPERSAPDGWEPPAGPYGGPFPAGKRGRVSDRPPAADYPAPGGRGARSGGFGGRGYPGPTPPPPDHPRGGFEGPSPSYARALARADPSPRPPAIRTGLPLHHQQSHSVSPAPERSGSRPRSGGDRERPGGHPHSGSERGQDWRRGDQGQHEPRPYHSEWLPPGPLHHRQRSPQGDTGREWRWGGRERDSRPGAASAAPEPPSNGHAARSAGAGPGPAAWGGAPMGSWGGPVRPYSPVSSPDVSRGGSPARGAAPTWAQGAAEQLSPPLSPMSSVGLSAPSQMPAAAPFADASAVDSGASASLLAAAASGERPSRPGGPVLPKPEATAAQPGPAALRSPLLDNGSAAAAAESAAPGGAAPPLPPAEPPGGAPGSAALLAGIEGVDAELASLQQQLRLLQADASKLQQDADRAAKAVEKIASKAPQPAVPDSGGSGASEEELSADSAAEAESEGVGKKDGTEEDDDEAWEPKQVASAAHSRAARAAADSDAAGSGRGKRGEAPPGLRHKLLRLPLAERRALVALGSAVGGAEDEAVRSRVARDNLAKIQAAHSQFAALVPDSMLRPAGEGGPLVPTAGAQFADVSELPCVESNRLGHQRARVGVEKVLRSELAQLLRTHVEAAVQYRERYEQYRQREEQRMLAEARRAAAVAAQQQPTSPLGRTLSRGGGGFGRGGEYVRSDYEEKIAIATLESLDLVKHMTQLPMMTIPSERQRRWAFVDRNRFVPDPLHAAGDAGVVRVWSDDERRIFMDKFLHYQKDFERIAKYLPGRTPQEVVRHYYQVQHTEEFSATRRKYQLRKRREQAESNKRSNYMGMQREDPQGPIARPASRTAVDPGGVAPPATGRGRTRVQRAALEVVPAAVPVEANPEPPRRRTTGRRAMRGRRSAVAELPFSSSEAEDYGAARSSQPGASQEWDPMQLDSGTEPSAAPRRTSRSAGEQQFLEAVWLHGKDMQAISRHLHGAKSKAAARLYWSRNCERLGLEGILLERTAQGLDNEDASDAAVQLRDAAARLLPGDLPNLQAWAPLVNQFMSAAAAGEESGAPDAPQQHSKPPLPLFTGQALASANELLPPQEEIMKLQALLQPGGVLHERMGPEAGALGRLLAQPAALLEHTPHTAGLLVRAMDEARALMQATAARAEARGLADGAGAPAAAGLACQRAPVSYWARQEKDAFVATFKVRLR